MASLSYTTFREHPVTDITLREPGDFDVVAVTGQPTNFCIEGTFSIHCYNEAVLNKIVSLPLRLLPAFLDFQCSIVLNPTAWLSALVELVETNEVRFSEGNQSLKVMRIWMYYEKHNNFFRKQVPPEFQLDNVRAELRKISGIDNQLVFLHDVRARYLEQGFPEDAHDHTSFCHMIQIEIDKLVALENIRRNWIGPKGAVIPKPNKLIPIKGPINVLVDAFFQMLFERKCAGEAYIDATTKRIVQLIYDNFTDRHGNRLSEESIRTMLSPGKPDKRPKIGTRLKVDGNDHSPL